MSNKLTALLLSVLVGSSSVAMADGYVRDHRDGGRFVPRAPAPVPAAEPMYYPTNTVIGTGASRYVGATVTRKGRGQVAAVTEPTRIDSGALYIEVAATARIADELVLQRVAGATYIEAVKIQFASGAWYVVRPKVQLTAAAGSLSIPLTFGEPVIQVQVHGASSTGSAFQLLGR